MIPTRPELIFTKVLQVSQVFLCFVKVQVCIFLPVDGTGSTGIYCRLISAAACSAKQGQERFLGRPEPARQHTPQAGKALARAPQS